MGQCFGRDSPGPFSRWTYRQSRGYDRFTQFAPKTSWKYADDHLLNEIQDPRSDDELDFSGINSSSRSKQTPHRTHNPRTQYTRTHSDHSHQ